MISVAIESILAQSFQDFELLVVGDGCLDQTADVVIGFDDDRIRWFDLPKGPGLGYQNRNFALRQARGEIVAWAQHDDLMFPDHLEQMVATLGEPNCHWAYSMPLWVSDDGLCIPFLHDLKKDLDFGFFMETANFAPSCCIALRRVCLETVGLLDPKIRNAGDWDLWTRIVQHYGQDAIGIVPFPTTLHFRASWRPIDRWAPGAWRATQKMVQDGSVIWPDALQLGLENNHALPQTSAARIMRTDPAHFVSSLREGVGDAKQRLLAAGFSFPTG